MFMGAHKAPAGFGDEKLGLAALAIIKGEMRRASLRQARHVKDQGASIGPLRAFQACMVAKLGQTEWTAIVVEPRIRHSASPLLQRAAAIFCRPLPPA
jgi:hypothetical protein